METDEGTGVMKNLMKIPDKGPSPNHGLLPVRSPLLMTPQRWKGMIDTDGLADRN